MTRASNKRSWAARSMNLRRERSVEPHRPTGPSEEKVMSGFEDIREHMEVIGADGAHIGTVDRVEDNRIKLIRSDSGIGHEEHHHYIPRGLVAEVEGNQVRLTARGDVVADLFEQEESGNPIGCSANRPLAEFSPSIATNDTGYAALHNWWALSATIPNSATVTAVTVRCGAKALAEIKVPPNT